MHLQSFKSSLDQFMAGWLDQILWCYRSNETSFADLLNGAIWSLQKEDWRMWIFYISLSLESGWEWKGDIMMYLGVNRRWLSLFTEFVLLLR